MTWTEQIEYRCDLQAMMRHGSENLRSTAPLYYSWWLSDFGRWYRAQGGLPPMPQQYLALSMSQSLLRTVTEQPLRLTPYLLSVRVPMAT